MSEPVPLSALEHHMYCPRQCALIHVDGLWCDNRHTVRGARGHARADTKADRHERGVRVMRALGLWSERLNLTGRADAVEFHDDGRIVPVEYKIGTRHEDAANVQLCAQAMCIEEMFDTWVEEGFVWYSARRRREHVRFTDALRSRTVDCILEIRTNMTSRRLPSAPADARCRECQFFGHCMPDLVANPRVVSAYVDRELFACGS